MTFPLSTPPLVVIEGLDGAGTTTQTERVARRLRSLGQPVSTSCEPSSGPVGALIRQMLSMRITIPGVDGAHRAVGTETLALLFAADRLDHLETEIEPALAQGSLVITDRYYHSSLVYQADTDGDAVDYSWVRRLNERARKPDLTVFLEASSKLCMERLADRGRRDIFESRRTLEQLEKRYDQVMTLVAGQGETVLRLDASRAIDELTDSIVAAISRLE